MAAYQAVATKAKATSIKTLEMIEAALVGKRGIRGACHFTKYLICCHVSHVFYIQYVAY